jgi:Na+/proline symporter
VRKHSSRYPLIGGFGDRTRQKNVIKARFGARTHLVFCTFAFFTNLIVMMSLTVAGTAVLNSLVADLSPELAAMLLAVVIGGYTLIGGLGATFYVSYFNTALIFFLIILLMVEVRENIKYSLSFNQLLDLFRSFSTHSSM